LLATPPEANKGLKSPIFYLTARVAELKSQLGSRPFAPRSAGMDMDRDIAELLKRLAALRARSKELGEQRQHLMEYIDVAVAQLHQAVDELADTKAKAKDTPRRAAK
jgi:hypothetical protein